MEHGEAPLYQQRCAYSLALNAMASWVTAMNNYAYWFEQSNTLERTLIVVPPVIAITAAFAGTKFFREQADAALGKLEGTIRSYFGNQR